MDEARKINFLGIISFIGAVLILLGIAWIVANNWHYFPDILKTLLLILATLMALTAGEVLKSKKMEFSSRCLLFLGGGLYVLSVFLIAQIYFSQSNEQGIANLLLICWPVLFLIAYLLDSVENILSGFGIFGFWVVFQYFILADNENAILTIILLFVLLGTFLYSLKQLHKAFNHKFYKVYSFWTVVYILLGGFLLTFQYVLSYGIINSQGNIGILNPFFMIIFIILSFASIFCLIFSITKLPQDRKEILIFLAIIFVIILSISVIRVSSYIGDSSNESGYCYQNNQYKCYNGNTEKSCSNLEGCVWVAEGNSRCNTDYTKTKQFCTDVNGVQICNSINCNNYRSDQSSCEKLAEYGCVWEKQGTCTDASSGEIQLDDCYTIKNKESCESQSTCKWKRSYNYRTSLNWFSYLLWIIYNAFFIILIILIIGFGKEENQKRIVDVAFLFFIIDIISRYIGFAMDLAGYVGFATVAIAGGIILIGGAYIIQKYWRKERTEVGSNKPKGN